MLAVGHIDGAWSGQQGTCPRAVVYACYARARPIKAAVSIQWETDERSRRRLGMVRRRYWEWLRRLVGVLPKREEEWQEVDLFACHFLRKKGEVEAEVAVTAPRH